MYLTDALRQDLASALRGLRKSPAFAVAALVTLSLGIGATSAIMAELDPAFPSCQKWAPSFLSFTRP
jgi:hypothetical protein